MMKKQRKSKSALRRIFYKVLGGILIIGIPSILFVNAFQLKNFTVQGAVRFTKEQIRDEILQTRFDTNTLLLYLKYQYFKDIRIPFIEKIDFEIVDKNTINVYVYEKRIVGCVNFLGDYLYFDKDGIVVESSSDRLQDIPQVTGLTFDRIILNEKLEVQKNELFSVILNLTQLNEKYSLGVDTISFNSKNEVTIYCGEIKVLLGEKSTYDEALSELKNILPKAEGMKLTIDMSDYSKGTEAIIAKPEKSTN